MTTEEKYIKNYGHIVSKKLAVIAIALMIGAVFMQSWILFIVSLVFFLFFVQMNPQLKD